jgi:hypothetical protein
MVGLAQYQFVSTRIKNSERFGYWRSLGIQGTNVQFSTNVDWNTNAQI